MAGTVEITRVAEHIYAIEPEAGAEQRFSNPGYALIGERIAVVEPGATVAADNLLAGLAQIGVRPEDVDYLFATHVHLDHAAAAGYLAGKMTKTLVAAHERGLPHLADPSRLRSAATDAYGTSAEGRYGAILPVPRDRLIALHDGQVFDLGRSLRLRAIYSPGHAPHHFAFFEEHAGVLFPGEAFPVYFSDVDLILPCVSPPFLDVDAAVASLRTLAALQPRVLAHPNGVERGDLASLVARAETVLLRWSTLVLDAMQEDPSVDHVHARLLSDVAASLSPRRVEDLAPVGQDLLKWHVEFAAPCYMEYHRRRGKG